MEKKDFCITGLMTGYRSLDWDSMNSPLISNGTFG